MRVFTPIGALALCTALTAACGDSSSSLNPTGPSAIARGSVAAATAGGETSTALGRGSNGTGRPADRQGPSAPAPPGNPAPGAPSRPRQVELEGRLTAVNAAARTLEVAGSTVTVPESVTIRHGQQPVPFGALQVGNRVHVRATTVEPAGAAGTTTLVATEVNVQSQQGATLGRGGDGER